jgi:hypothetical protein
MPKPWNHYCDARVVAEDASSIPASAAALLAAARSSAALICVAETESSTSAKP